MKPVELTRGNNAFPPATMTLVAINLAVFVAMLLHGAGLWHSPNNVQLTWGAGFGPATKDGEWWRLGSAIFLHFGIVHLAMNMVVLWEAGRLVERLYGPLRLFAVFLASGLTGNIVSLVARGDQAISGGASGAVFGVYGALLICLWRERRQFHPLEFRWLFGAAALFSTATVVLGFIIPGIDNAAHIGGLISGTLLGTALARPLVAESPSIGPERWVAVGVHCCALVALACAIPAPAYRWKQELQAREEIRQFQDNDRRIVERWQQILEKGDHGGATFEQLAGQIDLEVTREYRESFEELSSLQLDPAAPSTRAVLALRAYTQLRGEASQALAEALREKDPERFRKALEKARNAPFVARGVKPPTSPDSAHR